MSKNGMSLLPQTSPSRHIGAKEEIDLESSSSNGASSTTNNIRKKEVPSPAIVAHVTSPSHSQAPPPAHGLESLEEADLNWVNERKPSPSAPRLFEKVVYGFGASFGFNALVVTNGMMLDNYEDNYSISTSFLSAADFLIGVMTLYALIGFGYASDITTGPWGRRKPYIVALTPILAISLSLLYAPHLAPREILGAWFGILYAIVQICTAASTVIVAAWGTSLTSVGEERASLYTIDALMDLGGFLIGILITNVTRSRTAGVALGALFLIQNLLLITFLRDEPVKTTGGSSSSSSSSSPSSSVMPFIPGLHICFQNKQFLVLLLAATFSSIVGTTANLMPVFLQIVMHVDSVDINSIYTIYVEAVVASAFFTILGTQYLNSIWGKIEVLRMALAVGAFYGVLAFITSYSLSIQYFYLTAIPAGIFAGIAITNGNVLLSNTIDYDQLKTDMRRQSMYQCLLYLPITFVGVAGSAIPLSIITAFGGADSLAAGQNAPESVVLTIRLWVSLVVTFCLLISRRLMSNFKLTEAVQEEISSQLRRREQGELFVMRDPVYDHEFDPVLTNPFNPSGEGGRENVEDEEAEDAPDATPMSTPVTQASFLDLHFSARELALIMSPNGRRSILIVYSLDFIGSFFYTFSLLLQVIAAIKRNDLTGAEIISCLFVICSGLFVYEVCRLSAVEQLLTGLIERDLGKWARRKLAERQFNTQILRHPHRLLHGTIFFHACLTIVIISLFASVPVS